MGMGLDDALAAEGARFAAEGLERAARAAAEKRNRDAVDTACLRFAALAVERGLSPSALWGGVGWFIFDTGRSVYVHTDGTWVSISGASEFTLDLVSVPPNAESLESTMARILLAVRN